MLKLRFDLRKQRKAERKARHQAGEPLQTPNTIERMRLPDDSIVAHDKVEVIAEEQFDEFAGHFSGTTPPKLLFTTAPKTSAKLVSFADELSTVIPWATVLPRGKQTVGSIAPEAMGQGFTDLFVFSERNRKPDGLLLVHLPEGPTAHFRITNVKPRKAIRGHGNPTAYPPELILNNFPTRLGQRLARMLTAMFPVVPEFRARNISDLPQHA
jgi:ribosome production factor 1